MLKELGLGDDRLMSTHFRISRQSFDDGLVPLVADEDVLTLVKYVPKFTEIEVYLENMFHWLSDIPCLHREHQLTR